MRETDLPSPGANPNSFALRRIAANYLSNIQMVARAYPGGKNPQAGQLKAFFTACAAKCDAFIDSVLPTVTTRVLNSATQVTITFTEALSGSKKPLPAAFTVSAGGVVTAVAISGNTVVLTGTGFTVAATVVYVVPTPAAQKLQDPSGNLVAAFSGALA